MKRTLFTFYFALFTFLLAFGQQQWMQVHRYAQGTQWQIPLRVSHIDGMGVSDRTGELLITVQGNDEGQIQVPYNLAYVDSISFSRQLEDEEKGHDPYRVFSMYITTRDHAPVASRDDWVECHISVDGRGQYSHYSGTGRIRGRGNSTWEWYDKKPYRLRLDDASKLLGLDRAKNWNLLANYRDVTDLMNAFAFEAARVMGMSHTCHTRFVEVFLNGDYIGLYQLTEKVEVAENRIPLGTDGGVLLSLDLDDGPGLKPTSADNFWSAVYSLPVSVKYPDHPTAATLDSIRTDFAVLERAIKARDYARVDSLMDVESFMHLLQLHELLYNVELAAPRSIYLYREAGGRYTFGPVWDWDAGYDFDWSNMYTGHDYFGSTTGLILGTQPGTQTGARQGYSRFWSDMFRDATFTRRYRQLWASVSDTLLTHTWAQMERYLTHLSAGPYARDSRRWPIAGKEVHTEVQRMHTWLTRRMEVVNHAVANYPDGEDTPPDPVYEITDGIMHITQSIHYRQGYSQPVQIQIDPAMVADYLGGEPTRLHSLNPDGTLGTNTAAARYGAWYQADGYVGPWSDGHVYLESDDMYTITFGCHPENCRSGHTHTVRLRYQAGSRHLDVEIVFDIQ